MNQAMSAETPTAGTATERRGTPILMYHSFGAPGEAPGRYRVPAIRFARQLALLRVLRYRVLRLSELGAALREGRPVPRRSVVLTFDDGYEDIYQHAFPLLRKYGFPATLFVVSARVGARCEWTSDPELAGRSLCTWSQLSIMGGYGVEIGAHTRTHARLTALPAEAAAAEIAGSRRDLESALGWRVELFAYPYGDCDRNVERLVTDAGFTASCGVRSGLNDRRSPIQQLYRTEIFGTDSLPVFAAKLRSGASRALGSRQRAERAAVAIAAQHGRLSSPGEA
jgi:peptidoglycan/xylan/chitin deacetylase (PgdA/CDA1 family)